MESSEHRTDDPAANGRPPEYSPYTWWVNAELSLERSHRRRRKQRRYAITVNLICLALPLTILAIYLIVR